MEPRSKSSAHVDHQQELGDDVTVPRGPESPPVTAKVRVPVSDATVASEEERDRRASARRSRARRIVITGSGLFVLGVVVALASPRFGALAYGLGGVALCVAAAAGAYVWLGGDARSEDRTPPAPGG